MGRSTGYVSVSTPLPHNLAEEVSLTHFPMETKITHSAKTQNKTQGLNFYKLEGQHGSTACLVPFFFFNVSHLYHCTSVLLRLFTFCIV